MVPSGTEYPGTRGEREREGGVRRPREAESRMTEDTFDEHDLGALQEMIVRMYWKGVAMEEEERAVTLLHRNALPV